MCGTFATAMMGAERSAYALIIQRACRCQIVDGSEIRFVKARVANDPSASLGVDDWTRDS